MFPPNRILTRERKTWIVVCGVCAVVGFGIGNGHTTKNAIAHISEQYGSQVKVAQKAVASAKCEEWRANNGVAEDVCQHVGGK